MQLERLQTCIREHTMQQGHAVTRHSHRYQQQPGIKLQTYARQFAW